MITRKIIASAAFAVASIVGLSSPASAQSYGGITLSIGSGGYGGYDNYDGYQNGYDGYYQGRPSRYDYYANSGYDWRARQRNEQVRRWQQQEQRRRYWQHERREHHRWHNDDDDD